jgi:hypothetical protein
MDTSKKFGLSANAVKWIAYLAMLLDHVAYVFVPEDHPLYTVFRMMGRVAAPTMFFFVTEGYYHTSDLKRYMGRIALMTVISHVPYALCFGYDRVWEVWRVTSVMWTLLMGLVALTAVDRLEIKAHPQFNILAKMAAVALCCFFAYSADWNYIGVIWVVAFGVLRGHKGKQLLAFFLGVIINFVQICEYGLFPRHLFPLGILLFIPVLFLYNGERGSKNPVLKWAGYWFYPLHLSVIYLLSRIL